MYFFVDQVRAYHFGTDFFLWELTFLFLKLYFKVFGSFHEFNSCSLWMSSQIIIWRVYFCRRESSKVLGPTNFQNLTKHKVYFGKAEKFSAPSFKGFIQIIIRNKFVCGSLENGNMIVYPKWSLFKEFFLLM